jgi:hypothetical protein
MKPNGKYFAVVRAVVFVLCMAGMFSAMANAETAHGKFKLTTETRWGKLLLEPGEYEFTISNTAAVPVVMVRSEDSGWSAMILPKETSSPVLASGSSLLLGDSAAGAYVRTLALGDVGLTLDFGEPKAGKVTRLGEPKPTEMASASGSH